MTNEQVIKRINEIREILADYRELTSYDHEALDIAISALSKQSASCEQADKKLFGHGYWLMPGEVFISHNVLNEVLDTIIKSMNTEQRKIDSILAKTAENDEAPPDSDQIADGSKMVDQFREDTKKTDSERVSLSEQEKSNSFPEKLSEETVHEMNCSNVPDIHVGKTNFKPGDKFILELGQERKMFGEFEIKGTDLYIKTDLLEKLKRYEPEEKPEVKSEIICDPDCAGFVCSQNGIYGWCPKMERWGCEYFYELERRNDG